MLDEISLKILLSLREVGVARFRDLKLVVRNPRTLALKLERLSGLGLVEKMARGYKLTEKGVRVARILEELNTALNSPRLVVKNIERIPHAHLAPVIRRYCEILGDLLGGRLISVMLFGSIARGDWDRSSDIDLLIVAEGWEKKPIWERIEELREARRMLEGSPEYLEAMRAGYWPIIQNYPLSVDEAEKFNRIYLDAVIDGIILYDKDDFLMKILQSLRKRLEEMGSMRITLPNRKSYWILKRVKAGEMITL